METYTFQINFQQLKPYLTEEKTKIDKQRTNMRNRSGSEWMNQFENGASSHEKQEIKLKCTRSLIRTENF